MAFRKKGDCNKTLQTFTVTFVSLRALGKTALSLMNLPMGLKGAGQNRENGAALWTSKREGTLN